MTSTTVTITTPKKIKQLIQLENTPCRECLNQFLLIIGYHE
jgi:hypothetical protein